MTASVAAKELRVLWASPLPYAVGALFHAVLGLLFIDQLGARDQAVTQPLYPVAGFLLLMLVPVLTMRCLAEEARTGTLELLGAIPVPGSVLVVGKWLACWLTTLAVLMPALLLVGLVERFGDPDPGPVISGFIGLTALAAALTGLGVLGSALSSSQAAAAMVSLFVALPLWFAHAGTGATAASPAAVLARFSLSERLRALAGGLLDMGDVLFFLLLAAGALAVAVAAVETRRLR